MEEVAVLEVEVAGLETRLDEIVGVVEKKGHYLRYHGAYKELEKTASSCLRCLVALDECFLQKFVKCEVYESTQQRTIESS